MWFSRIKRFYDAGFWDKTMVGQAVVAGKITETQYIEITGEQYTA